LPSQEVDYGYGGSAPTSSFENSNDYGYGDAAPDNSIEYGYAEQEEEAPKRQELARDRSTARKLLEDFKNGVTLDGGTNTSQRQLGAKLGSNIMLPTVMPMAEQKPQRRGRRASLIGAVGVLTGTNKEDKTKKQEIAAPGYDPSKDRERHGSLMDRVGHLESRRPSTGRESATSANYSDRILSLR
jgi:hypothetical protein